MGGLIDINNSLSFMLVQFKEEFETFSFHPNYDNLMQNYQQFKVKSKLPSFPANTHVVAAGGSV